MTGAAAMMLRVLRVSILQGLCPKREQKKKIAPRLQRITLTPFCSIAAFNVLPRFRHAYLRQIKTAMLGHELIERRLSLPGSVVTMFANVHFDGVFQSQPEMQILSLFLTPVEICLSVRLRLALAFIQAFL
jgi:hypothetical protein